MGRQMKRNIVQILTLLLGISIGVIAGLFISPERRATLSRRLTIPVKSMLDQMPDG